MNYNYDEENYGYEEDSFESELMEDSDIELDEETELDEISEEDIEEVDYEGEYETDSSDDKELLTHEETIELIRKAKAGDIESRNILIEKNEGLIKRVARTFPQNVSFTFYDLVQEGVFGLMKAIEGFNIERNLKFSTYATWWIRQSIQRAYANNSRTIRIPVHVQEDVLRIKKTYKTLEQKLGRLPSEQEVFDEMQFDTSSYSKIVKHEYFQTLFDCIDDDGTVQEISSIIMEDLGFDANAEIVLKNIVELGKKMKRIPTVKEVDKKVNISLSKIKEILETDNNTNTSSLDVKVNDDMDSSIGENIASEDDVETLINNKMIQEGLLRALDEVFGSGKHTKEYYDKHKKKTDKQFIPKNELIKYRYGLGGYRKETLQELGERYGVSRERIRQIERNVIEGNSNDAIEFRRKVEEYCGNPYK